MNATLFNDEVLKKSNNEQYVKQITEITDEEDLKNADQAQKMGYISINDLLIAGTRDFSRDHIDDLKLPMNDTLNKQTRGRDADAYYRYHHEIGTIIGHSLGGPVALV